MSGTSAPDPFDTIQEDVAQEDVAPGEAPSLRALLNRAVVLRAFIVAGLIGTILTAVNQTDALFGPAPLQYLPLTLVFLSPFIVVTFSQLLATRRALVEAAAAKGAQDRASGAAESLLRTLLSHGIPKRAGLLALAVGCSNGAIMTLAALQDGGAMDEQSFRLLMQAFILPLVFGLLVQALVFRRIIARNG